MAPPEQSMTLAVTMGDPRGIGPEVALKAVRAAKLPPDVQLLIVGSLAVLRSEAAAMRLEVELAAAAGAEVPPGQRAAVLDIDNFQTERLSPRRPDADGGRASLDYIRKSVALALQGRVDGVITGPISKEAIGAAGSPFPGHTELLAKLTGAKRPVMMLVCPELRVALVTTHVALRDVPGALSAEAIAESAEILDAGLRLLFGIPSPRLAVCGLNPHCSDGGRFGDEEARIIRPAVDMARAAGVHLDGPKPADTVFAQAPGRYDAVLALYHDQGMIPVKMAGLGHVVNVTLGLPIIRTSVGHGTAYNIAGRGVADEGSLVEAIGLTVQMVHAARGTNAGAD